MSRAIKGKFRNLVDSRTRGLAQPPAFGAVHIARAENYDADLLAVLKVPVRALPPARAARGQARRPQAEPRRVSQAQVINTDPRFVDAVIELCKAEGAAEIIVAEGPGHWRNVEYLVEESGLGDVLRKHGVPFVDLNHDEPVKMPNLGRSTGLEYLYLSRTVATADVVISLPKLKTHHWAGRDAVAEEPVRHAARASATAGRRTNCTGAASTTASSTSP